ncbi:hypothetical protein [Inquilinus sp. OTU3971]|uniref:hypothetical protein n=1 Tax=Inquilinus sp. OTU3971 TaxID=3043855 RepID=UPI00313BF288
MPVLRPFTVLADAARRALRIAALILGRIGAARRRRAAEDRVLAALAERFPDAPEHWLRFIAERAPALASADETGAPRMRDIAAAPEPRRLPSPVGPRAVPDRAPVDPTAPAPRQRQRAPLLRLEPTTRQDRTEALPIRPKAQGLIRVLDPAGRRPRPVIGTNRPEPVPSPSTGTAEPSLPPPTAHAIEASGAQERAALPRPERGRPFSGFRRLARRIAGSVRAMTTILQRSRPGQSGPNADPQGERCGPTHLFVIADERSGRDPDIASATDRPVRKRAGPARQVSDRSGDRDLSLVSAAPSGKRTTDGVIARPPFDHRAEEPEGWAALTPAGRRPEHPVEPTRLRRVEAADPARPDRPARSGWPALPWTEPARIGDAPVDPPRLDRLRQEQEVGLWSV